MQVAAQRGRGDELWDVLHWEEVMAYAYFQVWYSRIPMTFDLHHHLASQHCQDDLARHALAGDRCGRVVVGISAYREHGS